MLKRIMMAAMLMGLLGAVTPPLWAFPSPSGTCTSVPEVEPNDFDPTTGQPQAQALGDLAAGSCVAISGAIHTGFGDPNNPNPGFDVDLFAFTLTGATQFRLAVVEPVALVAWDYSTGQFLDDAQWQCQMQDTTFVCDVVQARGCCTICTKPRRWGQCSAAPSPRSPGRVGHSPPSPHSSSRPSTLMASPVPRTPLLGLIPHISGLDNLSLGLADNLFCVLIVS